jgi:hypothetical protein
MSNPQILSEAALSTLEAQTSNMSEDSVTARLLATVRHYQSIVYRHASVDWFRNEQGELVLQIDPLGRSKIGGGDFIVNKATEKKLAEFLAASNGDRDRLAQALRQIEQLGGNLSDDMLTTRTGASDAVHRGNMIRRA